MRDARHQSSSVPAARRGGFTLTEILIVIGLILLIITLAIPALSVITGGRSVDAAQNQISAALARARQDAMGLQEPRGIIFFPDANTGRVVLAEVYYHRWRERRDQLELLPDREELELPVGVGCQVLPHAQDTPGGPTAGSGTPPYPTVGVIMFDGLGRVLIRSYYITADQDPNFTPRKDNQLWRRLDPLPRQIVPGFDNPSSPLGRAPSPSGIGGVLLTTQTGLLLYDQSGLNDAADKAAYLNDNATPVLLNRYNSALLPNR
jgi:hypothetical protein